VVADLVGLALSATRLEQTRSAASPSRTAGNETVAVAVLSYAGVLTITVVADPDAALELQQLTTSQQRELDARPSPHPHA
jgi:Ethanolamine utilization protein EutJ (predicted chaperonin)